MQDLRFGRTLSTPRSGFLNIPRQADLAMLFQLVEKLEWDRWRNFLNSNTTGQVGDG